ncbi:electron transfer flavoprotein subunit beta/FixA family protein [Phytoactinopolyspora alkaliphila]|uniref:Electron transfer flavoprotein subunit beta n=1 Tax=Phytoactinopolyspora alkaliphila TaxID=1783498 RepID=A0A6N9YQY2_9ACTN|nr:electron transfer flavoprotein subunit beta/FixA family protein [Phytoactinopolyspora alkaliphila]NED97384.1 electron transfer flavoprotein subunit beta/FixA family protein [Phytoactinopolyspora alkaliphila]
MKIVTLVKHVPDAAAERTFDGSDNTTDRTGVDGILSELDEYALEEALKISETAGDTEVIAVTMGPQGALDAVKRALQMGAGAAVHIVDDALHGSDAPATSEVLAAAIRKIGDVDLVVTGMASTDGGMGVVPAMLAERLGVAQVGFVGEFTVGDGKITARRDADSTETVEVRLPAIVSVTDQINEPRYPSFKGIMAAKKKPVQTWSLADLEVDPSTVGLAAAWTAVETVVARPARTQGEIVTDEGDGGTKLAEYLASQKFI